MFKYHIYVRICLQMYLTEGWVHVDVLYLLSCNYCL